MDGLHKSPCMQEIYFVLYFNVRCTLKSRKTMFNVGVWISGFSFTLLAVFQKSNRAKNL